MTYALTQAERDNLPYVISVRNNQLRLYSTATSGAVGQRGRTETYVELDLPLLAPDQAGYLDLLFSARALAENGSLAEIQRDSTEFTNELSERLRERVYREVVPRLAVAVARARDGEPTQASLDEDYHVAMTILFRLLFIAYGEDARLLPLHINAEYTGRSLKSAARDLADRINAEKDLGFDNPLTQAIEPTTDPHNTDLWDRCVELFQAVDRGHKRWGVPVYNGGLFSTDPAVSTIGARINELSLTNGDFGPALTALIVDRTPDGIVGPIDFRDLSVREFGTLYEGLLESELSVADQPLTIDKNQQYVPAKDPDKAIVPEGTILSPQPVGPAQVDRVVFHQALRRRPPDQPFGRARHRRAP
ncbi:MAG: hypothetical protein U5K73_08380 [Halofilum sp. (in: g-proteobacteria)]|nr:hypothetical protein [Halofilum sp. (in: g-proteobacteria)]